MTKQSGNVRTFLHSASIVNITKEHGLENTTGHGSTHSWYMQVYGVNWKPYVVPDYVGTVFYRVYINNPEIA